MARTINISSLSTNRQWNIKATLMFQKLAHYKHYWSLMFASKWSVFHQCGIDVASLPLWWTGMFLRGRHRWFINGLNVFSTEGAQNVTFFVFFYYPAILHFFFYIPPSSLSTSTKTSFFSDFDIKMFSSSYDKNSSILYFSLPTRTDKMNCEFTTFEETPTDLEFKLMTASGTGSSITIWIIGQSIRPQLRRLEFQLTQNVLFHNLTQGDKFTFIVIAKSKGDSPRDRRQDFTFVTDPSAPKVAPYGCFSTETTVTFPYIINGFCHHLLITLEFYTFYINYHLTRNTIS